MKIIKLLVLLFCAIDVQSYSNRYCEICRNHTLCKYSVGEPTTKCRAFDKGALLADEDIVEIVNRINARRNLVATGRLNRFPQAANMKKMKWSTELAIFAQRWADQCDPSVRPHKEDECRDQVGLQVGQSIAAVLGPTPGLNVKSFVDMWFMLKLHYTGSIVYYNQSRDDKTNYFTQLIWADTEYVGCGRAKFFNQGVKTVVERLVCNFAPKGNNHGNPVYTLGFPATQCPKFMKPDHEFPGLCKQDHETATNTVLDSSVSGLLRILDISNNSAKQELDPNNIEQITLNRTKTRDQRNQKTKNAYTNYPYGAIKRDSFHIMQNPLNPISDPENFKGQHFTPERGHSRMYHGHQPKVKRIQNFQSTQPFSDQDFRRFDLSTTVLPFSMHDHAADGGRVANNQNDYEFDSRRIISNQNDHTPDIRRLGSNSNNYTPDGRKNQNGHVCTRKPKWDDCFSKPCVTNQCTRGESHSCNSCSKVQPCSSCLQAPLTPIQPLSLPPAPLPLPVPSHNLCPCKISCPLPSPCDLNIKCPVCQSHSCPPSPICAKRRAQGDTQDLSKSTQFNYYDLFPNIGVRSGDENISHRKHYDSSDTVDSLENKVKEFEKVSSERRRRDLEDQMTFKPFWQMDEYNYKRPSELKALRYTTLSNKRNRKTRSTSRLPTESITIKLEDEIIHSGRNRDHITEKYLSFEELMHLRKLSTLEALDYEARRLGYDALRAATTTKKVNTITKKAAATTKKTAATTKKSVATTKKEATTTKKVATTTKTAATTTKTTATTKAVTTKKEPNAVTTITPNTPFVRLKHCTRKLTCTWTAVVMTGPDGAGGGMVEIGSRTPPGYVDGCTRTSTCTRDFMDRNKVSTTVSDEDTSESTPEGDDDGDYCEKRSLNVQRRNLDDTDKILRINIQEILTEMTPTTPETTHVTYRGIVDVPEILPYEHSACICNEDNSRVKREKISKFEQFLSKDCISRNQNENTKTMKTYEDLSYSALRKMSRPSKLNKILHQCSCNGTNSMYETFNLWYFFILHIVMQFIL